MRGRYRPIFQGEDAKRPPIAPQASVQTGDFGMSTQHRFTRLTRAAALSLALALPAASAALAQEAAQAPAGGWYATIGNPHPELPGFAKIARSENRVYADVYDPHPELTRGEGVLATNGSGAPLQPQTQTGEVSQSK
jgi:hypothetical protein